MLQALYNLVIRLGAFYFFILLGYISSRKIRFSDTLNKAATGLLINLMMPLLIIHTLLAADMTTSEAVLAIFTMTVLIHLLGFSIMFIRLRGKPILDKERGSYLLAVTFNNALFLPLPIAMIFLGPDAVPFIAIYSISQMILLASLGTIMASAYSESQRNHSAMIRKALTFPPLIAVMIVGIMLLFGVLIPSTFDPIFEVNSLVTTYLALFAVGLNLGSQSLFKRSRFMYEAVSIRQLLVPLIAWIALSAINLAPMVRNVILLQALMPAAVFTVVYAAAMDLDSECAASIVTLGTLLLLVVVPFLPLLFII